VAFLILATLFYLGDCLADENWSLGNEFRSPHECRHERLALWTGLLLLVLFWSSLIESLLLDRSGVAGIRAVGLVVMASGVVLRLLAIRALAAQFRTEVHVLRNRRLIRSGIYRWLRHPSKAGLLLIALGAVLGFASVAGVACWLAIAVFVRARIRCEEVGLREVFGSDYAAYAARTSAFPLL
jgi:protein-S-isoprenylcysteine O-methyltransferase Ste14